MFNCSFNTEIILLRPICEFSSKETSYHLKYAWKRLIFYGFLAKYFLIVLGVLVVLFFYINFGYAQEVNNNPQPLSDDFVLPMPDGRFMTFRSVCIGEGRGSYAWKRIRLGDTSGGYKESPTAVAVGGAFQVEKATGIDWCYYIGKYEVTEDQVFAILKDTSGKAGSLYPAHNITWFEVEEFIHKYNEWLYENTYQVLPMYGGIPGYIRLPTEVEWEFAARGGGNVSSADFDRKIPYESSDLTRREWFSGPKSSHNKLKKVGVLQPNVLGIHDILGNVMEMTRSLYQIEYYQGRSGGFVAKGGHYLTDAKQMRSSMRTEQEFYAFDTKSKKVYSSKKTTLGFRLLISSLVFPNRRISKQLKEDWELYRQNNAKSLPAAVSTSAVSNQAKVLGSEALAHLERLKHELEQSEILSESVSQEINMLMVSLNDIQFTIQQAEKDSAYAWIKIAGEQAFFIFKESRKLPVIEKLIKMTKNSSRKEVLEKYKNREEEIHQNIEQTMSAYTESIRQLGTSSADAIEDGFSRYVDFLMAREAGEQVAQLIRVRHHIDLYLKEKRTNETVWKTELIEWGAKNKQ